VDCTRSSESAQVVSVTVYAPALPREQSLVTSPHPPTFGRCRRARTSTSHVRSHPLSHLILILFFTLVVRLVYVCGDWVRRCFAELGFRVLICEIPRGSRLAAGDPLRPQEHDTFTTPPFRHHTYASLSAIRVANVLALIRRYSVHCTASRPSTMPALFPLDNLTGAAFVGFVLSVV
jgi:hypothetical protein